MKIRWNNNTTRWFQEASEYTGYNRILSKLLMKQIPHRGTICDMGCGAALIDYEFAKEFEQVTCVDISEEAIDFVNKIIDTNHISNINAVCCDGTTFKGSFDTVITLFHGGPNVFENYYPLAKEQLIIVTHLGMRHTFSPTKHLTAHNYGVSRTKEYLDEKNIHYHYMEQSIEYGQPFRNFEDAMLFMDTYAAPGMKKEEKIEHLKSKLENTENTEYPYYMPNHKKMGIFIINRKEN